MFKKSKLFWWNFLLFQWFFIRRGKVVDKNGNVIRWVWLTGILPLTGWWSDYIYIYIIKLKIENYDNK